MKYLLTFLVLTALSQVMASERLLGEKLADIGALIDAAEKPGSVAAASEISSRFQDSVDGIRLSELSDDDLRQLFGTANAVAFYSVRRSDVEFLKEIYDHLDRRGLATLVHARHVFGAFLQARAFDEAREFDATFDGDLGQSVPRMEAYADPMMPSMLLPTDEVLRPKTVDIDSGNKVVVIAHPHCAFSRSAMKAVESDPVLAELFNGSYWLVPQDRRLELEAIREWNEQATVSSLNLMLDKWKWPLPDASTTPTFYFLTNGKVTDVVQGWPEDGRRKELLAAFEARKY